MNDKINDCDRLTIKFNKQIETDKPEYENEEKKLHEMQKVIEKVEKQNDCYLKYKNEFINNQTHESQINILNNDYKILDQIFKAQEMLIDSMTKYSERMNTSHDIIFKKYQFNAVLNGLNIVEDKVSANNLNWFEIQILDLADDCLDEQYFGSYPESLKQIMLKLSPELMDKYRAIFRKRKTKNTNNGNNNNTNTNNNVNEKKCVVVNNLNDFQILNENYSVLLCFIMTKVEISEVKK